MSGTTFTWQSSGANDTDWNLAANWTPAGGPPNSATANALDNLGSISPVIAGGASDTVDNLTIATGSPSAGVFVGGNTITGGTGAGTLTATSITITSGELVGATGGAVNAGTISIGASGILGGGGSFTSTSGIANDGDLQADGALYGLGALIINGGTISGTGSMEIDGPSTLELGAVSAQTIYVSNAPGDTTALVLGSATNWTGTLNFQSTPNLDLFIAGETITGGTISPSGLMTLTGAGGATIKTIQLEGNTPDTTVVTPVAGGGVDIVTCFARGTRIATPHGAVAVEDLAEGDAVLTASGQTESIVWVGRRRIDCRRHPDPRQVWPVRIRAGAFGPDLPARDLLVSPQHAIHAADVLIPAKLLMNGSTVTQEQVASVDYFHIELARHEILLAEGLPSESYLDTGDRANFENAGGAMTLHPDFARWSWDARACAELKVTGPEVESVRAGLAARAEQLGREPSPSLAAG